VSRDVHESRATLILSVSQGGLLVGGPTRCDGVCVYVNSHRDFNDGNDDKGIVVTMATNKTRLPTVKNVYSYWIIPVRAACGLDEFVSGWS